ncbi:hypothetical protein FACS1894155_07580 [Bacteroidia bacterium]|nr:hypothetical protein FACS1894155_07580 [Bacteroidia bacterium]
MKTKFISLILFSLFITGTGIQAKEENSRRHAELTGKPGVPPRSVATKRTENAGEASPTLETERNLPRAGDRLVKLKAVHHPPGEPGADVTWNFNDLQPADGDHEVNYASYPNSELTAIENSSLYYYVISGDSLLSIGQENPLTVIRLEKPGDILIFPLKYGDERTGWFYGKGKYCDRLELDVSGLTYIQVDGYGRLVLPENDTICDVLRVYSSKITRTDFRPLTPGFDINAPRETALSYEDILTSLEQDTAYYVTETYRWYAEGSRYPVLETVSSRQVINDKTVNPVENTYVFHPLDQKELPEDKANQAILEDKAAKQPSLRATGNEKIVVNGGFTIGIYPNPVVNDLQISLHLSQEEPVAVSLYNLQGQLLLRKDFTGKTGDAVHTMDMSRYARGSYILKVQAGDKSERKVIVKQ